MSGLRALVIRAAEGTFLICLLCEHNLSRLVARSDEGVRQALREPLRLREWVTAPAGEQVASALISLLTSEHLTATGATPSHCPISTYIETSLATLKFLTIPSCLKARHNRAARYRAPFSYAVAAGGIAEDLFDRLALSCPAYFKEGNKISYEASGLLQRAEAASTAAEKDHLTRAALKLMLKVCCRLGPARIKHLASSP